MLGYYGGYWGIWGNPQKVTFDGPNKIIMINVNETEIDVRVDLYSNWKEWMAYQDNSKYLPAMRAVGGDPITDTQALGSTYFLINGWKILPWSGDYKLNITGNLYSDDGLDPILPTLEASNVSVNLKTSNLVDVQIVDNTISDKEPPSWLGLTGITNAYQNGDYINIAWASADDRSPVFYKVYISDNPDDMFTDASLLGSFRGNNMSISTEADQVSRLRNTTYYLGVRAIDVFNNETDNTNALTVNYATDSIQGVLTNVQHEKLMSLNNYDDTDLFNRLDQLGLTTEQHNQLMSLVNYDDKALRNLAYAILGA